MLNFYTRRWARTPGIDWASLYDPFHSIGSVTATNTFEIDTTEIRKLSTQEGDNVRIIWASDSNNFTDYELVAADRLKDHRYGQYVTRYGSTLKFAHTFTSSDIEFGGDIQVPAYIYPDELTGANDEIQVDDPDWVVLMAAAEFVRNDLTRQNQYPNLIAEANEAMQRMREDNENSQSSEAYRPWNPMPYGKGWGW